MTLKPRSSAATSISVAIIALLGACSPNAPASAAPVTVDNCGTQVTVTSPPQRVITIKSTPTEMMLALGLGDRLIGTAYQDGPVPAQWADDAAGIPILSDRIPGQEAVLALEPDFIYAGWESNVSATGGVGDRDALADLGIGTYVSPSACTDSEYQPDPLTFDDVFAEIAEVGDIFGVPERAAALIDTQRATLAGITPVQNVTAFWWSSATTTPFAGAGIGAPQLIMSTAGVTNILADVHATWSSAGWEDVLATDPDVLVLVDSPFNTFDAKVAFLQDDPALSQLTAVQEHRFVRLPWASTEAGVRNVEAVVSLVEQVRGLGLGS
jgi:iron complex transport system substrate-binding protein